MSKNIEVKIDDLIDRWHESDTEKTLWEYLGMSEIEYSLFLTECIIPPNYKIPKK